MKFLVGESYIGMAIIQKEFGEVGLNSLFSRGGSVSFPRKHHGSGSQHNQEIEGQAKVLYIEEIIS